MLFVCHPNQSICKIFIPESQPSHKDDADTSANGISRLPPGTPLELVSSSCAEPNSEASEAAAVSSQLGEAGAIQAEAESMSMLPTPDTLVSRESAPVNVVDVGGT